MRIVLLSIPASTDVAPRANGRIEIEDPHVNILPKNPLVFNTDNE
jgi:hypothetical protein